MYAVDIDNHEVIPNGLELMSTPFARGMSKLYRYAEVFEGNTLKMSPCPLLTEG